MQNRMGACLRPRFLYAGLCGNPCIAMAGQGSMGVTFACEQLQRNTKLKSRVVMSRHAWTQADHGTVGVGAVRRLFTYLPTWSVGEDDAVLLNVADVAWMKPYLCTAELDEAPEVSKVHCHRCEQGHLIRTEAIIPTYICI